MNAPRGTPNGVPTASACFRARGRVLGVAGAVVVLSVMVLTACAQGSGESQPPTAARRGHGLTITYGVRSHTFTDFTRVRCTTNESGDQVLQAVAGPRNAFHGDQLTSPVLSFEVRPDLLAETGPTYTLPEAGDDTDDNAFTLFAAAPTRRDHNEASSQEETATGTVTITNLSCGGHPSFTLTAAAELGSELSGPTIPIHGSLTYP